MTGTTTGKETFKHYQHRPYFRPFPSLSNQSYHPSNQTSHMDAILPSANCFGLSWCEIADLSPMHSHSDHIPIPCVAA